MISTQDSINSANVTTFGLLLLLPFDCEYLHFHSIIFQSLDVRDTQVSDSDIQCFNITSSLREILMECPPHLREKVSDKNPSEAIANDAVGAGSSKDIVENSTATADKSTESDIETGSEMDGEDSDDEEDGADDKNGANEENANENGSAASSNQNHYIQVIIQDGNLVNVNNGHIPSDQMNRAIGNGLRYMVGVVNGEGEISPKERQSKCKLIDKI